MCKCVKANEGIKTENNQQIISTSLCCVTSDSFKDYDGPMLEEFAAMRNQMPAGDYYKLLARDMSLTDIPKINLAFKRLGLHK